MARGSSAWHNVLMTELKKLPKSAKPRERGQAFKRASRIYHGKKLMSNPGSANKGLITLGIVAVAAFVGLKLLSGAKTPAPTTNGGGCKSCAASAGSCGIG